MMELLNDLGNKPIKDVIEEYPPIGEILGKYEIGCIECSIGTCLFKDVVKVHVLGDEVEAQIEKEINSYIENL